MLKSKFLMIEEMTRRFTCIGNAQTSTPILGEVVGQFWF